MNLFYFFLSESACRAVDEAPVPGITCMSGTREHLSQHLRTSPTLPTVIFADIADIDPSLHCTISHAQREHGALASIFPWNDKYSATLLAKLTSAKSRVPASECPIGVHDAEIPPGVARTETRPWVRDLHFDDVVECVAIQQWEALAVITAGRQTYCQLGDGCLHPGLTSPPVGVLTPEQIKCSNWFLQSCHSPFVWPSYGTYLSLPMALHFKGDARSIICSVRVQSYVPGLVHEWLTCIEAGLSAAATCIRLNAYVSSTRMDYDPFILLGMPDSVIGLPIHPSRSSQVPQYAVEHANKVPHATAQRMLANASFVLGTESFSFHQSSCVPANKHLARLQQCIQTLYNEHCAAIPTERSSSACWSAADSRPLSSDLRTWQALKNRFKRFWDSDTTKPGYYYRFGPALEHWYLPVSADFQSSSGTVIRTLRHGGIHVPRDYTYRRLTITPQGLVTRDTSLSYDDSLAMSSSEDNSIKVEYTNNTPDVQFVFALHRLTDPNNVSGSFNPTEPRSCSRHKIYRALLKKLRMSPKQWDSRLVPPGETTTFVGQLHVQADVFYLLLEVHIFVDFCWNWLSHTFAFGGIENWLQSPDYPLVLPARLNTSGKPPGE